MTAPRLKPEVSKANQVEPVFFPIEDDEPLAESERALVAEREALAAERAARLVDQQDLITERGTRVELERLPREHGIEPPA